MPDEDKKSGEDLEDHHAADDDDVDNIDDDDVDDDDKSDDTDDDKEDDPDEETVPVHVLQSLRKELQGVKKRLSLTQQQLLTAKEESKKEDPYAGLDDDDVLTVAEFKKIQEKISPKEEGYDPAAEAEFASTVDDYEEVIGKHLPELLKEAPELARTINKSDNPFAVAYELGKIAKANKKPTKSNTASAIRKAKTNAKKPGSPSASPGGEPSERFSRRAMDDDALEEHIARVKGAL